MKFVNFFLTALMLATAQVAQSHTAIAENPAPDSPPFSDAANAKMSALTLTNLGNQAYAAKKYQIAINFYTSAINAYPLPQALVGRGIAYSAINEQAKSGDDELAAAKIVGNNSTLYQYAGLSYYLAEKSDQAILSFTHAISLSPSTSKLYVQRADAYKSKSDWGNAFSDLKKRSN